MRLNLEMSSDQMDALKSLQKRTGAASMKELVNNALTVLEWACDETAAGRSVASISEDDRNYRILHTPLLSHVGKMERERNQVAVA